MTQDPVEGATRPGRRAVIAVAAVAAVAILVVVLILGSKRTWESQLVASVPVSGGGVTKLDEDRRRACVVIPAVPSSAGRAEYQIAGATAIRARVDVTSPKGTVRGTMGYVSVTGGVARLPLPAGATTAEAARVCIRSGQDAPFAVRGDNGSTALRLVGATKQSRLSQLGEELSRAGRAKGAPLHGVGGWAALVFGLTALGGGLAIAAAVWSRSDGWRPSRRTWIAVALVGLLHAWTWAALTPPYEVPDESAHVQYASYIADHGALPTGDEAGGAFSEKQQRASEVVNLGGVAFRPDLRPPWTRREDDAVGPQLRGLSGDVPDGTTTATAQPPFYYVSVAAGAVGGGNALDMLARMRLLSAAWLAIAALGAMALVRSAAPGRPKLWVTGGLAVALFPLLGFLAGGVTPDVAMTALALWLFAAAGWCWRDGLTTRNAAWFGVILVLLALTKLTALAVVPGALLIVFAALVRDWRAMGRAVPLRAIAVGAGVALIPFVAFAVYSVASGRALVSGVVGGSATTSASAVVNGSGLTGNIRENLVVTWQLFLFRLPMMKDFFGGVPLWDTWLEGLVGRFGYLDYVFSVTARRIVVAVWALVALLGVGGLVGMVRSLGVRSFLARYGPILVGGLVAVAGLMLVIGRVDYNSRLTGGPPFQQARYLLPALPVAVLVLALGLWGAGRRAAPYIGVLLVAGAAFWALAAFSITLTRYYG